MAALKDFNHGLDSFTPPPPSAAGLFFLKTFALTEAILTLSDVQPAPAGPQMIYDHNLLMHFSTFTEPSPCCEPRS
ncbi:ethylmalonyl-CoA/methylmalonyl-CoA decarboxylase [Sarotherodon galilaeus]